MAFMVIAATAIISGVSSWLGGRSKKKAAKKAAEEELKAQRLQGEEQRTTLAYQQTLKEWQDRKTRYNRKQGANNWTSYAKQNNSTVGPGMSALLNHVSAPPPAPGAMPAPPGSPQGGALGAVQSPLNIRQQNRG